MTRKPAGMERRASLIEVRAAGRKIEGYAAIFDQRVTVSDFTEAVAPAAFADTLRGDRDVLALVDHDPGRLLGRTKNGTLKLAEDQRGLVFSIDVPDTQLGRDMLAMAERGDLGGASFGFRVPKGGDVWEGRNRTLVRVELFDVGPVIAFPAYPQTSVTARSQTQSQLSIDLARRFTEMFR